LLPRRKALTGVEQARLFSVLRDRYLSRADAFVERQKL
jgi:hypothetical protein